MRWALVLALLAPSLVMAQDEGAHLSAPRPEGGPASITELRERWRALGYLDYSNDPREMVRAHRLARRERLRDQARERRQLRVDKPFTLRIEAFWTVTPRAINGFGPYDGNDGLSGYFGGGIGLTGSKWLTRALRVDVRAALGFIAGDFWIDDNQGPEGTLGVALSLHSAGRKRMGIGLGADLIVAREHDAATGTHFGWMGLRGTLVAEMGFITKQGLGLVLKMSPTLTWVPYANAPFPGIVSGFGVEFAR